MRASEFLGKPQRVSRLYPVLTLVLMLVSSSLVYAWKEGEITNNTAVITRDQEISSLKTQVGALSAQQKSDQATLQVQKQQITDSTAKLTDLQKELASSEQSLNTAQEQLKNQQAQLSANATQLKQLQSQPPLFNFKNDSALLDIDAKEASVKQLVTDAYTEITKLYGTPYLLQKVTITFVNSFTIPGASGEIIISNGSSGMSMDIHLKDFDKNDFNDVNSVLHELIHAWHSIAVLTPSVLEEGMTVAATDAVMLNMIADGKITNFGNYGSLYINISDSEYQSYNQSLKVRADSSTFYSDPLISKVYQLIGKAWYRLYQQDPDFFKKFNAAYYPKVQAGETVDATAILDIIRSIVPTVNGTPITTYLSANKAFNPS